MARNKRKKNPLSPPVLNESKPSAPDEFSIRCEDERSGSAFFGFISVKILAHNSAIPQ